MYPTILANPPKVFRIFMHTHIYTYNSYTIADTLNTCTSDDRKFDTGS